VATRDFGSPEDGPSIGVRERSVILRSLANELEVVLARITPSHLARYKTLLDDLSKKDVAADPGYQRVFNGFYKMQRRSTDWYGYFFSLLESKKTDAAVNFKDIIEQIYSDKGRVEPSFSSKLVATIRPESPVYDKHVRGNLSLEVPGSRNSAADRLKRFIATYSSLEQQMAALVTDPVFTKILRPAFDHKFKSYAHFTDVKKLDLLLWQHRRVVKSGPAGRSA